MELKTNWAFLEDEARSKSASYVVFCTEYYTSTYDTYGYG